MVEIKRKKFKCTLRVFKQIFHLLIVLFFFVFTILIDNKLYTLKSNFQNDSICDLPTKLDFVHSTSATNKSIGNFTKIQMEKCSPEKMKKNIVFIKTHKCASSTIQNILLRFGYKHKLKFVLPREGNYLGHPALFGHILVPPGKYNIIAHHTRLNYPEMMKVTPKDTIYITILRNPVALFESMYAYYKMEKYFNFKFEWFDLKNLTKFPNFARQAHEKIGINQMFFDLGFNLNSNRYDNHTAYIEYLDSIFDLIMIEEYMDESLILLKNLLCWSIDDVVAFKLNARLKKEKIGKLAASRIKKLNQADVHLYDFFLKKFKQKIANLPNIDEEVKELRRRRKLWFDECVDMKQFKKDLKQNLISKKITNAPEVIQYSTTKKNVTCEILTSDELSLTKFIRKEQLKLYPNSVYTSMFKPKLMLNSKKLRSKIRSTTTRKTTAKATSKSTIITYSTF